LDSGSIEQNRNRCARGRCNPRSVQITCFAASALILTVFFSVDIQMAEGQAQSPKPETPLPEAPHAQVATRAALPAAPCDVRIAGGGMGAAAANSAAVAGGATPRPTAPPLSCLPLLPLLNLPITNWYARFLNGPQVKPLTPKEKGWLAVRNVVDPFNGITILGSSAIAVGSNAHSAYGPGMSGFGRYVGVSYTQDITGEFFGTFLIPSIVHQDPHYHRMPTASMKRRIAHAIYQVVWTQGDNGKGMVNYANLVGYAIDDEISDLYVPGRQTNLPASAERYGTELASAPIDNFVSEFLPDLASHIHVQIVVIQRIINQVANKSGTTGSP
jgi:hypothetical protein